MACVCSKPIKAYFLGEFCSLSAQCRRNLDSISEIFCLQIERLKKAADDAKHQLDSKENIMKELSRDGSKLDKERFVTLHVRCLHMYDALEQHAPC